MKSITRSKEFLSNAQNIYLKLKQHERFLKMNKDSNIQKIAYIPLENLDESDAITAANVSYCGDKRGVDSHGVARIQKYFETL